jgi:hypothetical protein
MALVAGNMRVPKPATGIIAFIMSFYFTLLRPKRNGAI